MTVELEGRRRHGKTRLGIALALMFHYKTGFPIYTNEQKFISTGLAQRETLDTFLQESPGIHFDDELWRELDSWGFKDYEERKKIKFVNDFWQLQGHNDIHFIYTTQLHSQMTNRIRDTNDYIIHCEKRFNGEQYRFIYTVIDGYSGIKIKEIRYLNEQMQWIDKLYDYKGKVLSIFNG